MMELEFDLATKNLRQCSSRRMKKVPLYFKQRPPGCYTAADQSAGVTTPYFFLVVASKPRKEATLSYQYRKEPFLFDFKLLFIFLV